jgi:hypothetical protein
MPTGTFKTVVLKSIPLSLLLVAACLEDPAAPPAQLGGEPALDKVITASNAELIMPLGDPLATIGGVIVAHGGYGSALAVDSKDPTLFYSMTDRGPNVGRSCNGQNVLAFPVPGFTPQIGKFRLSGGAFELVGTILLRQANATPLNGFPHPNAAANRTEVPAQMDCTPLPQDPLGIDSEGLAFAKDGTFWVSDEYGPDVVHFSATGYTLQRLVPGGGLPQALARRRSNRGMEGLTILPDGKTLVGMMQSPLDNPTAGGSSAGRSSRLVRIVIIDTRSGVVRQYPYILDATSDINSEIAALTPTKFLVLERDGNFPGPGGSGAIKKVYSVDIEGATDISDPNDGLGGLLINGLTLEEVTKNAADPYATLLANGIVAGTKTLIVDLLQALPGYAHDKAEGLAVLDNFTIAVSNDDDFGVGDDGAGNFITKTLPLLGVADYNGVYIIRLSAPLK